MKKNDHYYFFYIFIQELMKSFKRLHTDTMYKTGHKPACI